MKNKNSVWQVSNNGTLCFNGLMAQPFPILPFYYPDELLEFYRDIKDHPKDIIIGLLKQRLS